MMCIKQGKGKGNIGQGKGNMSHGNGNGPT